MSQLPIQRLPPIEPITYPESDGQPMAETPWHGELMVDVKRRLTHRYRDQPDVQVGINVFLYFTEGDPKQVVSPDVYVTFGVSKERAGTYKVWVEGKAPDVVFEVTSRSTKANDLGKKKRVYKRIGVREYFLIDPTEDYLSPPIKGFRRVRGRFQPMRGVELVSEVLDIVFSFRDGQLTLTDRSTGATVPTPEEEQTALACREAARAEREAARATTEAARAEALMARVRDLEARLQRSGEAELVEAELVENQPTDE